MRLWDEIASLLAQGGSLTAATRDTCNTVEISRIAGAALGSDGRVYLAVPVPEGRKTLSNVDETGVVAFSVAIPSSYRTVQLKGTNATRADWPGMESIAAAHRTRFSSMMMKVGLPAQYARLLWSTAYVSIAFTPMHAYDQTPGPAAGRELVP